MNTSISTPIVQVKNVTKVYPGGVEALNVANTSDEGRVSERGLQSSYRWQVPRQRLLNEGMYARFRKHQTNRKMGRRRHSNHAVVDALRK